MDLVDTAGWRDELLRRLSEIFNYQLGFMDSSIESRKHYLDILINIAIL